MPLTAYAAPFCTESRMECAEPTKLRRKSGTWGTHRLQELAFLTILEAYPGLMSFPFTKLD